MQVTTKDIKKEGELCMKSPPPEVWREKGVFQIQPPISGVNFSNKISIPQVRVNMRETEHDTTFENSFLIINHKDKPFHNSKEWSDFRFTVFRILENT